MIDAVRSYYQYVKNRIVEYNSSRTVGGVVDAMDWPPKQVLPNTFYLLTVGDTTPKAMYSPFSMGEVSLLQWVWLVPGEDLTNSTRGKNRGNRFIINFQMKNELLIGLYPYFCEKQHWEADQVGNTIKLIGTSLTPKETIWWTPPRFLPPKFEETSGITYGAAQVSLTQWSDGIPVGMR
jgi:hypothetical protein